MKPKPKNESEKSKATEVKYLKSCVSDQRKKEEKTKMNSTKNLTNVFQTSELQNPLSK